MSKGENLASLSGSIERMFTSIAPNYDLLNRLLSMGLDKYWRRKAIDRLAPLNNESILDIATGTADFAIAASKIEKAQIFGIDISEYAIENCMKSLKGKLQIGNAISLPYPDNHFDLVISITTVHNLDLKECRKALMEIERVSKKN